MTASTASHQGCKASAEASKSSQYDLRHLHGKQQDSEGRDSNSRAEAAAAAGTHPIEITASYLGEYTATTHSGTHLRTHLDTHLATHLATHGGTHGRTHSAVHFIDQHGATQPRFSFYHFAKPCIAPRPLNCLQAVGQLPNLFRALLELLLQPRAQLAHLPLKRRSGVHLIHGVLFEGLAILLTLLDPALQLLKLGAGGLQSPSGLVCRIGDFPQNTLEALMLPHVLVHPGVDFLVVRPLAFIE